MLPSNRDRIAVRIENGTADGRQHGLLRTVFPKTVFPKTINADSERRGRNGSMVTEELRGLLRATIATVLSPPLRPCPQFCEMTGSRSEDGFHSVPPQCSSIVFFKTERQYWSPHLTAFRQRNWQYFRPWLTSDGDVRPVLPTQYVG